MDKLKQLATIGGKQQWSQYQEAVRKELLAGRHDNSIAIEFPEEPIRYPCLVASKANEIDITQPGSFARIVVSCCYVYPEDARHLLEVASRSNPNWNPMVTTKVETFLDLPRELAGVVDYDDDDYSPTELGTLTLALLLELKDIGALKLDKLTQRMAKVDDWLATQTAEELEYAQTIEIVEKIWGDSDVS
jgi:hypothetical protein